MICIFELMNQNYYNVIGVMSGTSLDGIDLAHIHFNLKDKKWDFEILEAETIAYNSEWLMQLQSAVNYSTDELHKLNEEYTVLLGSVISQFIKKNKIENLDAVCSHGHTILHQPHKGITLQIGNLPQIAQLTNQIVVCDFRTQDVDLGGQGAPLVPIGDRLLFNEYDYCMNLGGFSNISFEKNNLRIAFDISPVNTVLNFYANKLGLPYDDKGIISRGGKLNETLYNKLNQLDYYKLPFPKSLGVEFVNELVLPILESFDIPTEDKMHTFTKHVALQTKNALPELNQKLLITGGGAYNDFLIDSLKEIIPNTQIIIPEGKILEFKEALIFALLGILRLRNEVNCLSSVTGATKDHSSGKMLNKKG